MVLLFGAPSDRAQRTSSDRELCVRKMSMSVPAVAQSASPSVRRRSRTGGVDVALSAFLQDRRERSAPAEIVKGHAVEVGEVLEVARLWPALPLLPVAESRRTHADLLGRCALRQSGAGACEGQRSTKRSHVMTRCAGAEWS